ncbi:MAG: NAD(P)-dependent glycerol-3-phosphate dehydrogenase [Deltaproteobacteria bacterium]|nr:NAD(P)-dependent glycerol-3-phosphate dehydrogenase [Deltaproteobacteria bacterium]
MSSTIAVIGAGSWGTALARLLASQGRPVTLWAFEADLAARLQATRINDIYLPGVILPPSLTCTTDLTQAVHEATLVVLVTPSHVLRSVATQMAPALSPTAIITCCTKGIEIGTGRLMSEVLVEALPQHPTTLHTFLSGPSFAKEVAAEQPTAVVVAGTDRVATQRVQEVFRTPYFLTFTHDDVIGVEVGGAVKNVLAIATGIAEGLGLGHNTRAALITRGLYEMIKLGRVLGANPLTFAGLAGLGDLVLTCTGELSRNRQVGIALGQGTPLEKILRTMTMVAEGVATSKAVYALIQRHQLRAPICSAIYHILHAGMPPRAALTELTSMDLKDEFAEWLVK